jgi:DNA repair protein RecO (recombination protein O)
MQWTDEGIVLGTRRHGEASAIVELMTRAHGRHLGLVRGGGGARLRAVLQPGNVVSATWRARLDEHLGLYTIEGLRLRAAALLPVAHALYGVTHLAALARLLPERDPHPAVHDALEAVLDRIADPSVAGALVVRFELQMLSELGFGLDLDRCAATGEAADLVYVSPKSGRAVSRAAGKPWHHRLLELPAFLAASHRSTAGGESGGREKRASEGGDFSAAELNAGFALTGFFLVRHVFEPRGIAMPEARTHFLAALRRAETAVAGA